MERPQKITFGELRESGVHGVLIYCADYICSLATKSEKSRNLVRLNSVSRTSLVHGYLAWIRLDPTNKLFILKVMYV
jgi:hypothetical protein